MLPDLSAAQAAELASAFLADLFERLPGELAPAGIDVEVAWSLTPGEATPRQPVPAFVQRGRDLGERMLTAFAHTARPETETVIVGADFPDLSAAAVSEAFAALEEGAELILGPAVDGGFYLIALAPSARVEDLFAGIEWGSETVLARTLVNAERLGLSCRLLAPHADVDRFADLAPLAARLDLPGAPACPRTRRALADCGVPTAAALGGLP